MTWFCLVQNLQGGAPVRQLSWFITPITIWFIVLVTIVTGANLNQLITGGHHIVPFGHLKQLWKIPTLNDPNGGLQLGKSFVSMGHGFQFAMLNNQRVPMIGILHATCPWWWFHNKETWMKRVAHSVFARQKDMCSSWIVAMILDVLFLGFVRQSQYTIYMYVL